MARAPPPLALLLAWAAWTVLCEAGLPASLADSRGSARSGATAAGRPGLRLPGLDRRAGPAGPSRPTSPSSPSSPSRPTELAAGAAPERGQVPLGPGPRPEWAFAAACPADHDHSCRGIRHFTVDQAGVVYALSQTLRSYPWGDYIDYVLHVVSPGGHEQWNRTVFTDTDRNGTCRTMMIQDGTLLSACLPYWEPYWMNVTAFEPNGVQLWEGVDGEFVRDSLTVSSKGDIYLVQEFIDDHSLCLLESKTGECKRKYWVPMSSVESQPVFGADASVHFILRDSTNSSLIVKTHPNLTEQWRTRIEGVTQRADEELFLPIVAPDGTIYGSGQGFAENSTALFAVDASGKVKWVRQQACASTFNLGLGPHGVLYAVHGDCDIMEFGRARFMNRITVFESDGSQRWSRRLEGEVHAWEVRSDGAVLYSNSLCEAPGGPFCDAVTRATSPDGQLLWERRSRGKGRVVAGGDNSAYLLEGSSLSRLGSEGSVQWNFTDATGAFSAGVFGGSVYLGTEKGLYAFADAESLISSWV